MHDVISTKGLTKHFGHVKAVSDLSITIGKGEIYGFLGLNGAGKTTTIRMLLGLIRPTSGKAMILGQKTRADNSALWEKVGYLVESPSFYPDLTVLENLEITRRMRLIPEKTALKSVMDQLHLGKYASRKAKDLSQGNKQRLGLARALIHNPEILLLDEPSNALDPEGIVEIRDLLINLARNHGVTILVSSHILGEVAKIANRIGIIDEGKMIVELNAHELDDLCKKWLKVDALDRITAKKILEDAGFRFDEVNGHLETADTEAVTHPEKIASVLVANGVPPTLLKVEQEDLESFFLRSIGKH